MQNFERAPLERLIKIAKGDTHQAKHTADFLMSWWNAGRLGGFDLTDLWHMDDAIKSDILHVFEAIAANHGVYPDSFGYGNDFQEIIGRWRPEALSSTAVP